MASDKHLNYQSVLNRFRLSQTCDNSENDGIEESEVDNCLEKIRFTDLVKEGCRVSCRFFSFLSISSRTE